MHLEFYSPVEATLHDTARLNSRPCDQEAMCSITTISLDDFEKRILWSKCEGTIPRPPLTAVATMTSAVRKLFRASDSEKKSEDLRDVDVARVMVGLP